MVSVFQNFDVYPVYLKGLRARAASRSHPDILQALVEDRFVALHMLQPLLEGHGGTFALGGDEVSQRSWAHANGLDRNASPEAILLAQIEHSGAEVFYNMDPLRFGSDFVRKLPGCVRRAVAWRAAPSPGADFGAYDRVLCNFESILQSYRDRGWRAAWFAPAFDPVMDEYAREDRPVDVTFVGTFSRHHRRRAEIVEALASLGDRFAVRIHLQRSRLTRLAQTPLGALPPLRTHRLPGAIAAVAAPPIFGRDLYAAFGASRIVVNGAIDMSGSDRGNMRCWEALGCGAMMLSDAGTYPPGMEDGETIATYRSVDDMVAQLSRLLADDGRRAGIARAGNAMIRERYGKARQWADFVALL